MAEDTKLNRTSGQALLIPGVALLTLAGVLLPFERVASHLIELDPIARVVAIGPAVALIVALASMAACLLWNRPRQYGLRLLGAAAGGALGALLVALTAPHWLTTAVSPIALLR